MRGLRLVALAAFVCALQTSAAGQTLTLTLEQALARARDQAPTVLIARARIDEARGRLAGARVRYRENPTIDGSVGPRWMQPGIQTDFDIGLSQLLETGGQRAARIAGAEAAIVRESASADDTARIVLRDTALAFIRTMHAQERVALLKGAEETAGEVVEVASRRYSAGDIAVLDLNVAKSILARARSATIGAEAERISAASELQRVLGLPPGATVAVQGSLALRPAADRNQLIAAIENRPDLRAIRADIADAEADIRLGKAVGRPDLGIGARMNNEEGHLALLGALSVNLPLFNHGQELLATGAARTSRLRMELENTRARSISEVETAYAVYQMRRQAVEAFEQVALPTLDENQGLVQRSFDVGQISLPELLLIRRELVDARLEYLDRLLEAAEASIVQESIAGVLR